MTAVLEALPNAKLVSLTATPPYDVTGHEWQRYQELCGAIDEEVSVPELVQVGTLCPHQDYVFAVSPLKIDSDTLKVYDEAVLQICNELLDDETFLSITLHHPWVANPSASPQEILDNPELAIALLAYLKTRAEPLPNHLLNLMDTCPLDLPIMTRRWWHILIHSYLFDSVWESLAETNQHRDQLASRLRADGLLYRRELRINESRPIKIQLSLSGAKVQACIDVYRFERKVRGDGLRQVILTDFIRDEGVDAEGQGIIQLGSFPVFRALVDAIPKNESAHFGLLTGRIAILHQDRIPDLQKHLVDQSLSTTPLQNIPDFVKVNLSGSGRLTRAFTELISTDPRRLKVITTQLDDGSVSIALGGGTFFEQSLFADCMSELLGQIENPRYLLMRSGKLLGLERHDYHAVPTVLGINKDRAITIQATWNKWVGPSELLYTRNDNGRSILLKARSHAFSTAMEKQSNRLDQWQ